MTARKRSLAAFAAGALVAGASTAGATSAMLQARNGDRIRVNDDKVCVVIGGGIGCRQINGRGTSVILLNNGGAAITLTRSGRILSTCLPSGLCI